MPLRVVPARYTQEEAERQAAAEGLELSCLGHTRSRGRDALKGIWRSGVGHPIGGTLIGFRLSVPDDDAVSGQREQKFPLGNIIFKGMPDAKLAFARTKEGRAQAVRRLGVDYPPFCRAEMRPIGHLRVVARRSNALTCSLFTPLGN